MITAKEMLKNHQYAENISTQQHERSEGENLSALPWLKVKTPANEPEEPAKGTQRKSN